ncbi:MAG TPA: hypothetical protein VNU97_05655 [Rhizomicrobium sp.]|jgi:hypothetical protein|nr:hypothetical protein [Rhizomicrobium sp.]
MPAPLRALALAAIAGGTLRIVDSFTGTLLSAGTLAVLYFVTDILLLAGIAGLWLRRRATLIVAGTLGLAVFAVGIFMIRAAAFGIGAYRLGAGVALLGLAVYALETLATRRAAPWAPSLWLVSLVCGIAGTLGFEPPAMTALAGVAFGAGFVATGIETLTGQARLGA